MKDLWHRLEKCLKKPAPAALDFLNPPATEREIREAEKELGVRFPSDFVASLRVHNGQPEETGQPPHPIPFIPQEYEQGGVYRATFGELAAVSHVLNRTKWFRTAIETDFHSWAADFEYNGPVRRDGNWSWIIFVDSGSGDALGLDLNPAKQGQIGQVLSILHDPSSLLVLAPSYRDWFETLVTRFESGRYLFVEEDGELEAIDTFQTNASRRDDSGDPGILRFPGY